MGPHSERLYRRKFFLNFFKTGRLKIQSHTRDWPSLVFVLGKRTERRGVPSENEPILKSVYVDVHFLDHRLC